MSNPPRGSFDERPLRVLVAGAGVAGLEAILALGHLAGERVQITLLDPNEHFSYRALSVEAAFKPEPARSYSLATISQELGIDHVRDGFKWLDHEKREVHTQDGRTLPYDALLLAAGARRAPAFDYATTLDDGELPAQFEQLAAEMRAGRDGSVAMLVPSLPNWPLAIYELALMTATNAKHEGVTWKVMLVTPEDNPLQVFGAQASAVVSEALAGADVRVFTSRTPQMHAPGVVSLHPGYDELEVDYAYALPELYGPSLAGVPTSAERGFITVDSNCAVVGLDRVYAAGDAVDFPFKLGGIAAHQADTAATAIAAIAGADVEVRPSQAQIHAVLLGAERPIELVAQASYLHGINSQATVARGWTPSDKVHAAYLGPYLESLPASV